MIECNYKNMFGYGGHHLVFYNTIEDLKQIKDIIDNVYLKHEKRKLK